VHGVVLFLPFFLFFFYADWVLGIRVSTYLFFFFDCVFISFVIAASKIASKLVIMMMVHAHVRRFAE
jgi:hypothetical protein